MRKLDFTPKFKKDLSCIELAGIEKALDVTNASFLEDDTLYDNAVCPPTSEDCEFYYSSTSQYAMYCLSNDKIIAYDDNDMGIYLSHVALTENSMLILCCYDCLENDVYYEIEPKDFS
jgi:hypothetical protein